MELNLVKHTLLTAQDLPKHFKLDEGTLFLQLIENRYDFFDWGLPDANANILDNLVHNSESKILGFIFSFGVCFMQLYYIILNTTPLINIAVMTWVNQLKMVI